MSSLKMIFVSVFEQFTAPVAPEMHIVQMPEYSGKQ